MLIDYDILLVSEAIFSQYAGRILKHAKIWASS